MIDHFSKLVEKAVEEFSKLPGIGKKTSLRMILYLLKQPESYTTNITESLATLRANIKYCEECHIIADTKACTCRNMNRDTSTICVVEETPDAIAIGNTGKYRGMFHILGGKIDPVNGKGPNQLNSDSLVKRVANNPEIKEIIFALSSTMEGDTTVFYLSKLLKKFDLKITNIARGVPIGGELEYIDEITLAKSILFRTVVQ